MQVDGLRMIWEEWHLGGNNLRSAPSISDKAESFALRAIHAPESLPR